MQERRPHRAVAVVTAALLLIVGWLGAWHEADVLHVRDQRGEVIHGEGLSERHEVSRAAHLHGHGDHDRDFGACDLVATAHASIACGSAPQGLALAALARAPGAPVLVEPGGAIAGYRIAPKTSPPALR